MCASREDAERQKKEQDSGEHLENQSQNLAVQSDLPKTTEEEPSDAVVEEPLQQGNVSSVFGASLYYYLCTYIYIV